MSDQEESYILRSAIVDAAMAWAIGQPFQVAEKESAALKSLDAACLEYMEYCGYAM